MRWAGQHPCSDESPLERPKLRELLALAALATFGCGLALAQGDLLFLAIFAAACGERACAYSCGRAIASGEIIDFAKVIA